MFSELRPNMTRYSTIEEVDAALAEVEENDYTSLDKNTNEKPSGVDSSKNTSPTTVNGKNSSNGVEGNGTAPDEALENDSYSESESIDLEGQDDEEELLFDDKFNDGSDGDNEVDSDDEDKVHVRQNITRIDPKEDFDRELKALTQESLDSRKLEYRGRPTLNMAMPMNIFEGTAKEESGEETVDEEGGSNSEMNSKVRVKVLVKKGNKQQTKQMLIPKDSTLVQSTKQKEAEEMEEKESIKRRILEYNEREEEELNGVSSIGNNWLQPGSGSSSSGGGGNSSNSSRSYGGRGNWEHSGRRGGFRQSRQYSSGGFYHGYVRRR